VTGFAFLPVRRVVHGRPVAGSRKPTTGDAQPVTYNGILPNGNINPVSVTLRIPTDRRNAINMDAGLFAQDRWTISRMTINAGIRYDQFIGSTLPESLPASTLNTATSFSNCPDGLNSLQNNCTGRVQNWKDISPRIGLSFDVFGDGKGPRSRRASPAT